MKKIILITLLVMLGNAYALTPTPTPVTKYEVTIQKVKVKIINDIYFPDVDIKVLQGSVYSWTLSADKKSFSGKSTVEAKDLTTKVSVITEKVSTTDVSYKAVSVKVMPTPTRTVTVGKTK